MSLLALLQLLLNTADRILHRFYLLSPATSYAGDYIWQGDARTGCERILRDTGVAKEEWQMGTTKAFIKNPETVSLLYLTRNLPRALISVLPIALCLGAHAGPVLAQYGAQNPEGLEKLPTLQE